MVFEYRPGRLGAALDESRCRASVADGGRAVTCHQCLNKAKHEGKWCSIHRPGAAEERARKRGPTQFEREVAAQERAAKYVDKLEAGIRAVSELIAQSTGVAGLYLNGDEAPWEDLLKGGRYESWLSAFSEAAEAAEGEP